MANKPDYDEMTDERLMACVQNSEHGAFAVLVRRHSKMFFAAAYRMDREGLIQAIAAGFDPSKPG